MNSAILSDRSATAFLFGKNDAMLLKVFDKAAVGMAIAGMDGQVVYVNQAFTRDFGFARDLRDLPRLEDIIEPADGEARGNIGRLLRGEIDDYQGEHVCNGADGRPVRVLLAASVLRSDTSGQPMYLIVQLSSIEERKRAEEALAASESRWHFALESARQGVWDHDARTDRMFYSPMWRKLRGIPQDEPVDDSREGWLSRVHPEDRERINGTVDKQNKGDDGYDILLYRERHREGHYVWILSRGKPVEWDEHGNVLRTIGTDTDITHLKAVEGQLEAEKERWRVTLEAIADATVCVDMDRRITFMNAAAREWTELSFPAAEGLPVEKVLEIESADPHACAKLVERCFESGATQRLDGDAVLVSRNGERRDVLCSVSPVRLSDGARIGAVIVLQNVTRSRSLQRQLEYAATHDSLTGLSNRAAFQNALAEAARSEGPHCLLFIDLDNFKPVNDEMGHAAGDEILKQVGEAICAAARSGDTCARIGGDEFTVLMRDCGPQEAQSVADALCEALKDLHSCASGETALSASLGLTKIVPGEPPDRALARADEACYRAKRAGKARLRHA